ncbi:MAG: glucose-6-phosphate isomerase [Streptosporangiales bacterium]|nr:glucose-6-phosphate isomerase [Streptosporangiales bacterium]
MSEAQVSAAGTTVTTWGAAREAQEAELAPLIDAGVPAALAAKDPGLWGEAARPEAEIRLDWISLPETSRDLLPTLRDLADEVRGAGLDHVVLAGMGGSSLAPEVITRTTGRPLTVLDTTDPGQVRAALADRLDRTVVVVSSKSGGTTETDSHRRAYEQAFRDAGIDPARRIIVVTDPGSPLESQAREAGYRVVLADPGVGGRYSALTAFGLVPSALAGVDVAGLLDEAAAMVSCLAKPYDNPGLALGAVIGGFAATGHDKLVIADAGSGLAGFGDWAEQLIAESTGKDGKGVLPVVVEDTAAPGFAPAPDAHLLSLGGLNVGGAEGTADTGVAGHLGAQFLIWEYATAIAGRILGINPFDQPNVQESKDNTEALLEAGGASADEPLFTEGAVEVHAPDPAVLHGARDLAGAVEALLESLPAAGYLAVLAYLDRHADASAAGLRRGLAARTPHPVTFGWGPRFLHSTGQYHKGGPQVGSFLQVTGAIADDLPVPGRPYSFGALQAAQAAGDLRALAGRGRPTVRLHLRDRAEGLAQLSAAIERGGA